MNRLNVGTFRILVTVSSSPEELRQFTVPSTVGYQFITLDYFIFATMKEKNLSHGSNLYCPDYW